MLIPDGSSFLKYIFDGCYYETGFRDNEFREKEEEYLRSISFFNSSSSTGVFLLFRLTGVLFYESVYFFFRVYCLFILTLCLHFLKDRSNDLPDCLIRRSIPTSICIKVTDTMDQPTYVRASKSDKKSVTQNRW